MQRLGKDNYDKKTLSATDKLSPDDIQDLLEDYNEANITTIPINTHIRYFQKINGKPKFRMGGFLSNNSGLPKYVVLNNGKKSWSVQIKEGTIFYQKMTLNEIKNEYEERIDELEDKIKELTIYINHLKQKLKGK